MRYLILACTALLAASFAALAHDGHAHLGNGMPLNRDALTIVGVEEATPERVPISVSVQQYPRSVHEYLEVSMLVRTTGTHRVANVMPFSVRPSGHTEAWWYMYDQPEGGTSLMYFGAWGKYQSFRTWGYPLGPFCDYEGWMYHKILVEGGCVYDPYDNVRWVTRRINWYHWRTYLEAEWLATGTVTLWAEPHVESRLWQSPTGTTPQPEWVEIGPATMSMEVLATATALYSTQQ